MGAAVIAGSPDWVEAGADALHSGGTALLEASESVAAHGRSVTADWQGTASDAARDACDMASSRIGVGADAVVDAAPVLRTYAAELRAAQQSYAAAEQTLAAAGDREQQVLSRPRSDDSTQLIRTEQAVQRAQHDAATARDAMQVAEQRALQANQDAAWRIDALTEPLDAMRMSLVSSTTAGVVLTPMPLGYATMGDDELRRALAVPPTDPDDLRALLDAARAAGFAPADYKDALKLYWQGVAYDRAGINEAAWQPELGASANRQTVLDVYSYYGALFLAHPELEWAGMANMIGPAFAAGIFDLASVRRVAGALAAMPSVRPEQAGMQALANISNADLRYYETTLLSMQKEIFEDQASMHEAYLAGGMPAIRELGAAGLLDPRTVSGWQQIDEGRRRGDANSVHAGNTELLRREQFRVIGDDYDEMRGHPVTGEAFTYAITLVGAPSIPGAKTYAQVGPIIWDGAVHGVDYVGTPRRLSPFRPFVNGPSIGLPHAGVEVPHLEVDVVTPLPDGNIADRTQRWELIKRDTLPAYEATLETDQARDIIATPVESRVADQRMSAQADELVRRLVDWQARPEFDRHVGWDVGW